jgi:CheY-like chemotaxis protein
MKLAAKAPLAGTQRRSSSPTVYRRPSVQAVRPAPTAFAERLGVALVVEDDEPLREFLCTALISEGYDAVGVRHGAEALAFLDDHASSVCAILLDLNMPVMDGCEFGEACLDQPELARIPLFIVSGSPDARWHIARLHATACFEKPFDLDRLMATVNEHCGQSAK